MNIEKAGELLGKFWEDYDYDELDEAIYWIDLFLKYLYDEGYEVREKKE